jgi:hypothetical protein
MMRFVEVCIGSDSPTLLFKSKKNKRNFTLFNWSRSRKKTNVRTDQSTRCYHDERGLSAEAKRLYPYKELNAYNRGL